LDLSFHEGDNIKLINKHPSGWWEGELNGKIGFFPCTFVKDETKCFYVRALYDYDGRDSTKDLSFKTGDRIKVVDNSNPSGWWKGELSGFSGFFPCNFVEKEAK